MITVPVTPDKITGMDPGLTLLEKVAPVNEV